MKSDNKSLKKPLMGFAVVGADMFLKNEQNLHDISFNIHIIHSNCLIKDNF